MSEHNAIGSALLTKLTGAGGTVVWSSRVYDRLAPQKATLPYLIFNHVSGGEQNITQTDYIDTLYDVRVIANTSPDSKSGAGYIRTALHNQAITITGWNLVGCQCVGIISRITTIEGVNFFTDGFEVRIRADKA